MNDWKTIDTAPKDGTKVDLWMNGRRFVDCYWSKKNNVWYCLNSDKEGNRYKIYKEPTHWMPLPQPPTKGN